MEDINISNNNVNDSALPSTAEEVKFCVFEQTMDAMTRGWRKEPRYPNEQERLYTSFVITELVEEMVDANVNMVNSYMLRHGFRVQADEFGAFGWIFWEDGLDDAEPSDVEEISAEE